MTEPTADERPTFTPAPDDAPPSEADTYDVPEDEEPHSTNTEPATVDDDPDDEPAV